MDSLVISCQTRSTAAQYIFQGMCTATLPGSKSTDSLPYQLPAKGFASEWGFSVAFVPASHPSTAVAIVLASSGAPLSCWCEGTSPRSFQASVMLLSITEGGLLDYLHVPVACSITRFWGPKWLFGGSSTVLSRGTKYGWGDVSSWTFVLKAGMLVFWLDYSVNVFTGWNLSTSNLDTLWW